MIRQCRWSEVDEVCGVINDAAAAYAGVIARDCWHVPYMSRDELDRELEAAVVFWGVFEGGQLRGVMGLQHMDDVTLIRHAYTRTANQRTGVGSTLLTHLCHQTDRPVLVGTWRAAIWAVRFYEKHGFRLVTDRDKQALLRRYWTIPDRQIEESVVLADARWVARHGVESSGRG